MYMSMQTSPVPCRGKFLLGKTELQRCRASRRFPLESITLNPKSPSVVFSTGTVFHWLQASPCEECDFRTSQSMKTTVIFGDLDESEDV